ncbi:MAG: hypothetical protein QMD03_09885 [Syntrophales bacterium]|nr:hypothetical protein [Syntrophales bacterium]
MPSSLMHRYTYGNSEWPSVFSPEGEIVYKGPRREREMILLAQKQIQAQYETGRGIALSQLAGAKVISAEIMKQTAVLEMGFTRMESALGEFAGDISNSINELGDRLSADLSEIKWQLAQQEESLREILAVLRDSRNNEAQQLLRQGLRHYTKGEFAEAEERFCRALDYDTTDYQVLMNLAFIEMHKENADDAYRFFDKALSLPETLDPESRFRTLWATARLYYAQGNYEMAYKYAIEALKHGKKNRPKELFIAGTYAALSGKTPIALKEIEEAIDQDCTLFTLSTSYPDLQSVHQEVIGLLSRKSKSALDRATTRLRTLEDIFAETSKGGKVSELAKLKQDISDYLDEANSVIKNDPAYSDCLTVSDNLNILAKTIDNLAKLQMLYTEKKKLKTKEEKKKSEIEYYRETIPPTADVGAFGCFSTIAFFVLWIVITLISNSGSTGFTLSLLIAVGSYGAAKLWEMDRNETHKNMNNVLSDMQKEASEWYNSAYGLSLEIKDLMSASDKQLESLCRKGFRKGAD